MSGQDGTESGLVEPQGVCPAQKEATTAKPGQTGSSRARTGKPRAVSEIPLRGRELVELVLVGRGQLREGGIGLAEGTGRGMGPGYGPGVGEPQAEVFQNPADDERVVDKGDHAHLGGAPGTLQGIDFVDLLY